MYMTVINILIKSKIYVTNAVIASGINEKKKNNVDTTNYNAS